MCKATSLRVRPQGRSSRAWARPYFCACRPYPQSSPETTRCGGCDNAVPRRRVPWSTSRSDRAPQLAAARSAGTMADSGSRQASPRKARPKQGHPRASAWPARSKHVATIAPWLVRHRRYQAEQRSSCRAERQPSSSTLRITRRQKVALTTVTAAPGDPRAVRVQDPSPSGKPTRAGPSDRNQPG